MAPPPVAPKSPDAKKKYESVSKRTKSDSDVLEKMKKDSSPGPPGGTVRQLASQAGASLAGGSVEGGLVGESLSQKEEREGNVRQISLMFERRSSLRGTERPAIEQSVGRAEKLEELEEAAIKEVEEKMHAEQEHKVRQLSQLFERQNSSQSDGRRSLDRQIDPDDRMARSASWAAAL